MTRPVPRWVRRILGILTLGGGAAGFVSVVVSFVSADSRLAQAICVVFALLYGTGVVCGMLLIEGSARVTRWCYTYWQLQMPVVVTGWYGYQFTSGLNLVLWVRPYEGNVGFTYFLGTPWFITIMRTIGPTSWGINVFALAIVLVLRWFLPRKPKADAAVRVPVAGLAGAPSAAPVPVVSAPVTVTPVPVAAAPSTAAPIAPMAATDVASPDQP